MAGKFEFRVHLTHILTCCLLLSGAPAAMAYRFPFFTMGFQNPHPPESESSLVRVHVVTKFRDAKDSVEINGKQIAGNSPLIIISFSAAGIVLNPQGHVLAFLGDYHRLDIRNDSLIEVSRQGQTWRGKLVGIDQTNGAAVIRIVGGTLKITPTCSECKVKDGATVMTPLSVGTSQFRQAQIVSVGADLEAPDPNDFIITVDHPFPDAGQPILTSDHRVLGFIASQDPMGLRNVVYPISELLASAEKIIRKGGSIDTGWLGLFVDSNPAAGPGVFVQDVVLGSPAQIAGLIPGDRLLKYNGKRIVDSNQYIRFVERSAVGSKANLEIVRKGNPMTVTALIGTRRPQPSLDRLSFNLPEAFGFPVSAVIQEPAPRNQKLLIGVDTLLLDMELAQALQIPLQKGVVVIGVQPKSPAELSGVLLGDVIESIDGQPIADALSFTTFMQTHNWGSRVFLQVNRKGVSLTIPVQLSNR
jgi:serine protease Do